MNDAELEIIKAEAEVAGAVERLRVLRERIGGAASPTPHAPASAKARPVRRGPVAVRPPDKPISDRTAAAGRAALQRAPGFEVIG